MSVSLREIPLAQLTRLDPPVPKIHTENDILVWTQTRSFEDYSIFLHRLNESVVGYFLPWESEKPPLVITTIVPNLYKMHSACP